MSVALISDALAAVADFTGSVSATVLASDRLKVQINTISGLVQKELGRTLRRGSFGANNPELVRGRGGEYLQLSVFPIESVASVVMIGASPPVFPITDGTEVEDFQILQPAAEYGGLYRKSRWALWAPVADNVTSNIDARKAGFNYAVQYTAGFVLPNDTAPSSPLVPYDKFTAPNGWQALPWDIRQAVFDEVLAGLQGSLSGAFAGGQRITEERTAGGWSRKYADTSSAKGATTKRLSSATMDILANYAPKRWA